MANRAGTAKAAIAARTFGARPPEPGLRTPARQLRRADAEPGGALPDPERKGDAGAVLERLWALCEAHPPANYAPPWDDMARELQKRLAAALTARQALSAAGAASRLSYPACTRALIRGAPAVNRVVSEIRGLALAADLSWSAEPPKTAEPIPGIPLVYEFLAY